MFTGIVEELGSVVSIEMLDDAARLTIRGDVVASDAAHGDSIAVNGVCLTVVDVLDSPANDGPREGRAFTADVMAETLKRSSLGVLHAGSAVNLERAAAVNSRLGGHIVQGHVDGVGHIIDRTPSEHWEIVRISVPDALTRYIVEKGSITVDGVSLTVVEVRDSRTREAVADLSRTREAVAEDMGNNDDQGWFSVSLIPTTLELTTLGVKTSGDAVNLEVDIIAKYVEKLVSWRTQ